jgi:hypothetical protein
MSEGLLTVAAFAGMTVIGLYLVAYTWSLTRYSTGSLTKTTTSLSRPRHWRRWLRGPPDHHVACETPPDSASSPRAGSSRRLVVTKIATLHDGRAAIPAKGDADALASCSSRDADLRLVGCCCFSRGILIPGE